MAGPAGYQFEGKVYESRATLVTALANNWEKAKRHLYTCLLYTSRGGPRAADSGMRFYAGNGHGGIRRPDRALLVASRSHR